MSYHVHMTDEAERDLRCIFEYIAFHLRSLENASGQLSRLEDEILSLNEMPERYRRYELEPWHSRGVRRFAVDNYCIFYLPDSEKKEVYVLRVLYAGRDLDRIMAEYAEEAGDQAKQEEQ